MQDNMYMYMIATKKESSMLEYQGIQYARVTEVLKPFTSFDHIDPVVLQRKAELGSHVHDAIHDCCRGEAPVLTANAYGYFESFQHWKDVIKPEFIRLEQRLYCKSLRLTGQLDALVKMPYEDLPVILDYKTSSQESPTVWPMQAHLYNQLLKANGISCSDRFLFLKLNKDGKPPAAFVYYFDAYTHQVCMKAVHDFWKSHHVHVDINS